METLGVISTIIGWMLLIIAGLCVLAPVLSPFLSLTRGTWNWREALVLVSMLATAVVCGIAGYALVFMHG
jgi:hypothetical protein